MESIFNSRQQAKRTRSLLMNSVEKAIKYICGFRDTPKMVVVTGQPPANCLSSLTQSTTNYLTYN